MSISTTGRKVKASKRRGEMFGVDNKNPHHMAALSYNHVRVQFPNGEEKHLLFTDSQIKRAMRRADHNPEDLPKTTWLREIWYEGFIETGISDLEEVINKRRLPNAALEYNHIRVDFEGKEVHLLFTDNDIGIALARTGKNPEDLPAVSWLADMAD